MASKITLRAARVNSGLTQDDIAAKLGVARSVVNLWETGKRPMRPAYLFAYCYITGFDESDIDKTSILLVNEST